MTTAARDLAGPTLAEIRQWPATCSITEASIALGISPSHGYELARCGEFPVRGLQVRRRWRIITADLVRVLSGEAGGEAA